MYKARLSIIITEKAAHIDFLLLLGLIITEKAAHIDSLLGHLFIHLLGGKTSSSLKFRQPLDQTLYQAVFLCQLILQARNCALHERYLAFLMRSILSERI
jgi:hypothetical protein